MIAGRSTSPAAAGQKSRVISRGLALLTTAVILAVAATGASAQQASSTAAPPVAIYPGKGQTPDQQKTDQAECNSWAVSNSGYDPAHPPVAAVAHPAPVTGSGARLRGAAAGAAVGAIGGNDVGNAAAKGAVAGGVVRRNKNRAAAAGANEAAAQQQQAGMAAYQNAIRACMEGRGYTVK
jgi:hypothetical protein